MAKWICLVKIQPATKVSLRDKVDVGASVSLLIRPSNGEFALFCRLVAQIFHALCNILISGTMTPRYQRNLNNLESFVAPEKRLRGSHQKPLQRKPALRLPLDETYIIGSASLSVCPLAEEPQPVQSEA